MAEAKRRGYRKHLQQWQATAGIDIQDYLGGLDAPVTAGPQPPRYLPRDQFRERGNGTGLVKAH